MSRTPTVAVITPTKNRRKLLIEALDSVRGQTFQDWEHIVVDDGSEDGTDEEVLSRAAVDPRVRYIQRKNEPAGANVCRNIGIRESRAELIVFLDSDDLLEPGCLQRRFAIMERNADLDFATFQRSEFEVKPGDLGKKISPDFLGDDLTRFLFCEIPWITTAPIWRKAVLFQLGLFDEMLPHWQDADLSIRAVCAGAHYLRFPDIDHHVRTWRDPSRINMQMSLRSHLEASRPILEKFERVVAEGPGMNWMRQRALCSLHFVSAEGWLSAGHLDEALRLWRRILERRLGNKLLYYSGAALLIMEAAGLPTHSIISRLVNKWKGWMRLRTNADLIKA